MNTRRNAPYIENPSKEIHDYVLKMEAPPIVIASDSVSTSYPASSLLHINEHLRTFGSNVFVLLGVGAE